MGRIKNNIDGTTLIQPWTINACVISCSVVSDSLWPYALLPARLLYSWDFPGKNAKVGCHFLFQWISPTQDQTRVACISCTGRQILYCWTTRNLSIENRLLTFYVSGYVPWTIYMWIMVLVCVLNHFSLVQLFATLWAVACHAPLSMGFSRQKYWSGLPCPLPGDILEPGIELVSCFSCTAGRLYPLSHLGSLWMMVVNIKEHFHIM